MSLFSVILGFGFIGAIAYVSIARVHID